MFYWKTNNSSGFSCHPPNGFLSVRILSTLLFKPPPLSFTYINQFPHHQIDISPLILLILPRFSLLVWLWLIELFIGNPIAFTPSTSTSIPPLKFLEPSLAYIHLLSFMISIRHFPCYISICSSRPFCGFVFIWSDGPLYYLCCSVIQILNNSALVCISSVILSRLSDESTNIRVIHQVSARTYRTVSTVWVSGSWCTLCNHCSAHYSLFEPLQAIPIHRQSFPFHHHTQIKPIVTVESLDINVSDQHY